jgi:hypothetical protein
VLDQHSRGLSISKGAVPGLSRGLGHTAPTYIVGSRDRYPTAIAARASQGCAMFLAKSALRARALARRGETSIEAAAAYATYLAAEGANKPICAVGVAYASQEFPEVPHEEHDENLDYVLTERELISCRVLR